MRDQGRIAGALLIGVGLAYLLDPDRGARRRALVRDRAARAGQKLADGLDATTRDLRNRAGGTAAELRSRFRHEQVDDSVLHERVRSAIGRAVSHPGAIQVTVSDGTVTLRGQVLEHEIGGLIATAERVRGVSEVVNELDVHKTEAGVPSLQGAGRRQTRGGQESWNPATRIAVGAVGAGLLARALSLFPTTGSSQGGMRQWRIQVQKTMNVSAPVDRVWELWSNYENFPRFMSHLREVSRTGEGRSRWVAVGPGGASVSWDAVTTEWVPNERIAWKSVEGAAVENEGRVQFRPNPDGGTQVDVKMSYNPPGGAVGHAVASLLGTDPKRAMDEDMVRLKSLLEAGRTSADEGRVRLDEVATGSSGDTAAGRS